MEEDVKYNEDLGFDFTEEELEELSDFRFDKDSHVDESLEKLKFYMAEKERYEQIYNERMEQLKAELETKTEKLDSKIEWIKNKLKYYTLNSPNKKETKTLYKLSLLSGEIQVKKARQKMVKPKITEENEGLIVEKFKDYIKQKIDLEWGELKKELIIKDGKVYSARNNEDLSDLILVEDTPEEVIIK